MNRSLEQLEKSLQEELRKGWKDFLQSELFATHRDFAIFLDGLEEFQQVHRKTIPHPPHEFAARHIGQPFMQKLMELGIFTSYWFPGDFYASKEVHYEHDSDEDVHARVFELDLLVDKGQKKLCQLTLAFPHMHEGFGFLSPTVKVTECYIGDEGEIQSYLNQELINAA